MNAIKSALRSHTEWILIAAGILLVVIIGWILVWGVAVIARDLGSSLGTPRAQQAADKFDLEGAAKLDFRGLE